MIIFKEIEIKGLFGEVDVNIPIKDNRIIIVGYNGIGKSTILNIFYYFISQQWSRLIELEFSSVTIKFKNKNKKLTIKRSDLDEYQNYRRRGKRFPRYGYRVERNLVKEAYQLLENSESPSLLRDYSNQKITMRDDVLLIRKHMGVPLRVAEELFHEVLYLHQRDFELEFESETFRSVLEVDKFLSENMEGRILYLPTYRRIEKDIKTVFPEIEEELQRKLARRRNESLRNENYIELVQFGMEDVKENLAERLERVKAYALAQINSLTTKYLRDVIRDEAKKYEEISSSKISEDALKPVFTKVDSEVLSDEDKDKIKVVVQKMASGSDLLENEKYVAHYVLYLVEVGKNIAELELPIRKFVEICNSYLFGKNFVFDNISYEVKIIHESFRPVEMEELSSGEKQIVSLFSHLLLDQSVSNYIIIDEPELSLSVDWQQRFLEDISNISTCKFIGAVTHSPFIFENSLDVNTLDLSEHMKTIQ